MTRAPWRPQDVPDALLGRPSRQPVNAALLGEYGDVELDVGDADEVFVIMIPGHLGDQPLVWPMRLHVHGPDCNRA